MDRRTFLLRVGVGALASSLPVAIAACTPEAATKPTAQQPVDSKPSVVGGFTAVGTVQDLDKNGFIQDKKFAAGPLLVVRDPSDKTKLLAFNATCTHKGCVVDWSDQSKGFLCPCHATEFKANGSVAKGPATQPLAKFAVKTEGSSILVSAS